MKIRNMLWECKIRQVQDDNKLVVRYLDDTYWTSAPPLQKNMPVVTANAERV